MALIRLASWLLDRRGSTARLMLTQGLLALPAGCASTRPPDARKATPAPKLAASADGRLYLALSWRRLAAPAGCSPAGGLARGGTQAMRLASPGQAAVRKRPLVFTRVSVVISSRNLKISACVYDASYEFFF